jgi:hypothetical protein
MHSSVISKSVLIVIALLMLASCDHRGSKVEADKVKGVKSAMKAGATHNSRVASASTGTTTKNTFDYNGITQFK